MMRSPETTIPATTVNPTHGVAWANLIKRCLAIIPWVAMILFIPAIFVLWTLLA